MSKTHGYLNCCLPRHSTTRSCLFNVCSMFFLFDFSKISAHDMLVKHLIIGGLSLAACRIFFLGSRKAENRLTHHEWTGKKTSWKWTMSLDNIIFHPWFWHKLAFLMSLPMFSDVIFLRWNVHRSRWVLLVSMFTTPNFPHCHVSQVWVAIPVTCKWEVLPSLKLTAKAPENRGFPPGSLEIPIGNHYF